MLNTSAQHFKNLYADNFDEQELREMFGKRENDRMFEKVGMAQSGNKFDKTSNVWLGFEILTDSPYLKQRLTPKEWR